MSAEIVTCPADRFSDLLATAEIGFSETVSPEFAARIERVFEADRFLVAVDRSTFVATAGVFSFRLAVPGFDGSREVRAGGVTWVTVLPSHRRQGLLRAMMRRMLDDCRARGEPVAVLWASEAPIYQRFGFGLATLSLNLDAETRATAFVREWPREGSFRFVSPEEAIPLVDTIFEAASRQRAGFVARTPDWWRVYLPDPEKDRRGGEAKRAVVFESGDGPEAYAIYSVKADWNLRGTAGQLTVDEAVGCTPRGTRAIWRWLFDVDLVRSLRTFRLPPDHALLGLVAEPRRLGLSVGDGVWLRIIDVAEALEGRGYRGEGRLSFELADEFCPWNAGRWSLEVRDGAARVERTQADPDLLLDANDLGALYLGRVAPSVLAEAGRIVELRPGAAAAGDTLFPTPRQPWCPSEF